MNASAVERSARGVALFALGAAPVAWLVWHPAFLFPFVVPKVLWLRACAWLVLAAGAVWLVARGRRRRPAPTGVDAAMVAFLGVAVLATLFAVDPLRSLWDTSERMAGLVTLLHLGVLYAGWAVALRDARARRALLRAWVAAGALAALVGLAQRAAPALTQSLGLPGAGARVGGTLGHPLHLAHAGLVTVFAGGLLATRETRRAARGAAVLAAVLGGAAVLVSETRGSLLGLCAGGVAGALALGPGTRGGRLALAASAAGLALGAAAWAGVPGLEDLPGLRRLAGLRLDAGTAGTRLVAWDMALDAWQARPVLGWGPRSFALAAGEHFDPRILEIAPDEIWWDAPHNAFLEALVAGGVLGLAAYAGLFAAAALRILRMPAGAQRGWLAGLLAAHAVHAGLAFESATSWAALFFWLALARSPDRPRTSTDSSRSSVGAGWACLAAIALAGIGLALFVVGPARRSLATTRAFQAVVRLAPDARARVDDRLGSGGPHAGEAALLLSDGLRATLQARVRRGRAGEAGALARRLDTALARHAERHPRDVRIPWARAGLALDVARTLGDREALAAAEPALAAAVRRAPTLPPLRRRLAQVHAARDP